MKDYAHLLKTSENLESQIEFAQLLCEKFRENDDMKMADMYNNIYESLKKLDKSESVKS